MDKNKMHLIPPLVVDRVDALDNGKSQEACEIYAQQLEAIRDYCDEALYRYAKRKSAKPTWKKSA